MVLATFTPESKERMLLSDLPEIDLSWEKDKVRKLVVKACENFGFFKVINHGVPMEVIDNVEKESKEFFSLPAAEKQKIGPSNPLGYGSKKIGFSGDTGDLEYLLFQANFACIHQRLSAISEDTNKLSCVLCDYVSLVKELACYLLELIGEGLGLNDKKSFSKLIKDSQNDSLIRVNHYPSNETNADKSFSIMKNKDGKGSRIGFGEHSDPQIITILRSNDVEGLQIQSPTDGNSWIPVKSDPSAFFINVGDTLQAMTNGRLVSVRHRVVVTAKNSRLSTMFFAAPSLQTCISPLLEMVTHENPLRYRPYTWAEYKKIMYTFKLAFNRLDLFQSDCKKKSIYLLR